MYQTNNLFRHIFLIQMLAKTNRAERLIGKKVYTSKAKQIYYDSMIFFSPLLAYLDLLHS